MTSATYFADIATSYANQVFAGEMKDFVTSELVAYCDGMCEEHSS